MNSSRLLHEMERLPALLEQELQAFFHRQKERYEYGISLSRFFSTCANLSKEREAHPSVAFSSHLPGFGWGEGFGRQDL